jgi:hypothetical protein
LRLDPSPDSKLVLNSSRRGNAPQFVHDPLFVGDIYKELAYVNEKYNNNPEILAKLNQASAQE